MARLLVAAAALAAAAAAPPPRLRGAQRAIAQTIPHTRHWLAGAAGDDPAAADDAAADDDDPSFVQGYFFVIVIALVLFCGCTCLSVNAWQPEHGGAYARLVGYDGSESRPPDEQRFVLLRDSLAESGEAAWVCFVCAFENKARARSCLLCGGASDLSRAFEDRLRSRKGDSLTGSTGSRGARPRGSDARPPTPDGLSDDGDAARPSNDRCSVERCSVSGRGSSEGGQSARPQRCWPQRRSESPTLSAEARAQAFAIRRLNDLTLRQKGAARRRVWQRVRDGNAVHWTRAALEEDRQSLAFVVSEAEGALAWNPITAPPAPAAASEPASSAEPPPPDDEAAACCACCGPRAAAPERRRRPNGSLFEPREPRGAAAVDDEDLEYVASRPFREKQLWFERALDGLHGTDPRRPRSRSYRPVTLDVRRGACLFDSLKRFEQLSVDRLRNASVRVRFAGEAGIDAGGVSREWFDVVARELFANGGLGLFVARRESGYACNLDPRSGDARHDAARAALAPRGELARGETIGDVRLLRFAGRFVAKALRERVTIPATLSLPLLKHVLGVPLSFSDLEFVDAEAFLNYAWLRDNGGAEDLCLDFTIFADGDDEGAPKTPVELVPNGGDVPVTDDNKAEFLALVLKYKVLDAVAPQLAAFLQGFDDILPRTYLSVFDYQELQLLLGGVDEIDVDDWRRHTRYLGAFAELREKHPVVKFFWDCVDAFDNEQRARLCQFSTGTSSLPPAGFKALVGDDGHYCNFTLASLPRDLGVWPRAHTCFNRIDLPLYESYDELANYLALSIHLEVVGFTID